MSKPEAKLVRGASAGTELVTRRDQDGMQNGYKYSHGSLHHVSLLTSFPSADPIKMCMVQLDTAEQYLGGIYKLACDLQTKSDAAGIAMFRVRFKDLERMRDQYQDAYTNLKGLPVDEAVLQQADHHYNKFYDMFYSVQVMAEGFLNSSGTRVEPRSTPQFQLPKINLSSFSGVYTEWPNFIGLFDSLIHNNESLSNVQKLHYLFNALDKEPLALVKHLQLDDRNYDIAYQLLKERYENKRLIADKHLEAILSVTLGQGSIVNLRKFVNTIKENSMALGALGFDVESWSFLLLHIILRKLTQDLRSRFELSLDGSPSTIPTFSCLLAFLENQLRVLETVGGSKGSGNQGSSGASHGRASLTAMALSCVLCRGDHSIYNCGTFNAMTPHQRKDVVTQQRLCYNCLRSHSASRCTSKSRCSVCNGHHHTKLHLQPVQSTPSASPPIAASSSSSSMVVPTESQPAASEHSASSLSSTICGGSVQSTMLLGTAMVGVHDCHGHVHIVRALMDSGSQVSIITENLAQKLRLPRSTSGVLYGLGGTSAQRTNGSIEIRVTSRHDRSHTGLVTTAVVLKRITGSLPSASVSPSVMERCKHITLADDRLSTPGPIDILIGVDLYSQVFKGGSYQLGEGFPTAHESVFGWILMGQAPVNSPQVCGLMSLSCTTDELNSTLSKFWEVEEVPATVVQDPENILCERHFVETHTRDETGRFIVRLPFKSTHMPLGDTRTYALKRFFNLERKLQRDARLHQLYSAFMADYLETGHMRPVSTPSCSDRYYIPHHGVLKESSSTTKLRAVFDASHPSSTGVSLNQILMPGPKLQQHISDIILRFRTYAVVFTCDIKQMYRNVRMHDDDCRFQTIFWRESPDQPLQEFELTTVTYGVSSSAYQAIRVLHELANINEDKCPEVARILREDTFVDDVVSGCGFLEEAKQLQQQVVDVLSQGGFTVRKWASNRDEVLQGYPSDHLESPFRFEESGDNIFKILGIEWSSDSDSFVYHVSPFGRCRSKREIMSNVARIYDPCGYLTPVTFKAKAFLQGLWSQNLGWDEPLSEELITEWNSFAEGFVNLRLPRIPRFISTDQPQSCELMGFSDASESGYAAVLYLRVLDASGEATVHLLMGKSRVAPIKQKMTIPRLELSGAFLLARMMHHVLQVLQSKMTVDHSVAWCDSSIALAWIHTPPHKLGVFEGNRVSQIQGLVPSTEWRHVPSALNPADCASRGLRPDEIVGHDMWWSPSWLRDDPSNWPENIAVNTSSAQVNTGTIASEDETVAVDATLIVGRYSSLSKTKRTMAWVLRFIRNVRSGNHPSKCDSSVVPQPLTVSELDGALLRMIRLVQIASFSEEILALREKKPLKRLSQLSPFLDSEGLLRVGGRLRHSSLPFSAKHPILLPSKHLLTDMIIDYCHVTHMHAGPACLISVLSQRFWIPSARRVVRHRIHLCHRCHRLKARPLQPLMGDLPPNRVGQIRPFLKVGIDFAGPFFVKASTLRNAKIHKAYLCVFVCFATKAMHLEVTSDLTTDAFLAAFHRFVSRRGMASDVHSDCGKNFQGAKRHLSEVQDFLRSKQSDIDAALVGQGVKWHMNPPYSPHMGGLWESAVKSAKQLLKRTIGDRVLTFEELSTVFCRIEAVLNSRPLCALSNDPNDLEALTPGHFLIGQPLVAAPEPCFEEIPMPRLKRWQLVQQISQHVWRRWQLEYLHTLQQRGKWVKDLPNLQLGDLVLIKEDHLPPLQWRKGRVLRLHPGPDGVVRVVELRTSSGTCLRSLAKLCRLPTQD